MILQSTANVWSLTIIARADGQITLSPVNVPKELEQTLVELLRRRYGRSLAVPTS